MEKPIYPSRVMRITQGFGTGSHVDSYAIDEAAADQGISSIQAPFTGVIKKIYTTDANEVWLESIDPVEYPDGTIDYMTVLFAHSNDVSNLFVGKRIERGEDFYTEGTKGQATGNHCHIECGKGKFTGTGWYKNSNGNYSINNGKRPDECFWIDENITIINSNNYNFKTIPSAPKPEIPPTEALPQPTPEPEIDPSPLQPEDNPQLIFTCPKTDLYGIYLKEGQKVYLQ